VERIEKAELKSVSWGYFWMLTSDRNYELLTVDHCCCATCRDIGFENYNELRNAQYRRGYGCNVFEGYERNHEFARHKAEMLQRVDKEAVEEFRQGLFQTFLKPEGSCGSHCRTNLLSTQCNPNF
jgi:hypothetical protein